MEEQHQSIRSPPAALILVHLTCITLFIELLTTTGSRLVEAINIYIVTCDTRTTPLAYDTSGSNYRMCQSIPLGFGQDVFEDP
jgi:hypothetical protein